MRSISDDSNSESNASSKHIKPEHVYAEEIEFALNFIKSKFNKEELKNGIFTDKNNKTRSKTKVPFDSVKTDALKSRYLF